jgi:hypothetical protein
MNRLEVSYSDKWILKRYNALLFCLTCFIISDASVLAVIKAFEEAA